MALIRIKEGSLTIEVYDDDDNLVLLARTVKLKGKPVSFNGAVVEVYKRNNAGAHVPGAIKEDGPGRARIG